MAKFRHAPFLIITDIVRNNEDGNGVDLIRRVRSLPDSLTVAGGLRVRHLPIIVISGWAHKYEEEIIEIDSAIPVLWKPWTAKKICRAIFDSISTYRHKVLSDLEHVGLAIVWQDGHFRAINAYSLPEAKRIATKYISGKANDVSDSYSRLVLVSEGSQVGEVLIEQFEEMLNSSETTERDIQAFFDLHPRFVLQEEYDSYWSQPTLRSEQSGADIRPDYVLQARGLREHPNKWAIVDLKSPAVPLFTKKKFHQDLSHHVYRVATQLRDYGEFFQDPQNEELIRQKFGGIKPSPQLVAIIGRLPVGDMDRYSQLQNRIAGVCIRTYDEVIEFQRARVSWQRALGM